MTWIELDDPACPFAPPDEVMCEIPVWSRPLVVNVSNLNKTSTESSIVCVVRHLTPCPAIGILNLSDTLVFWRSFFCSVTQLPQVICVQTRAQPQTALAKLADLLPDAVGKKTFLGGDTRLASSASGITIANTEANCVPATVNRSVSSPTDKELNAADATSPASPAQSPRESNKDAKFLGAVLQVPDGL